MILIDYTKTNGEYFKGKRNSNYFEGWYYKLVSKDLNKVYAFIPGISYPKNEDNAHSFVQVINGKTGETNYVEYPANSFNPVNNTSSIMIDNNLFSKHGMRLNINNDKIYINGKVYFDKITQLEKNCMSPGAMGFFGYFSFMECFHEVISMSHNLKGKLQINNELIDFDNGKGYIEKDWGTSFPKSYIWIHSNHFSDQTTSLMCSIAKIPFLSCSFTGFICILTVRGMEYRFATYNNSRIDEFITLKNEICISLKNSDYTLQITGYKKDSGSLKAPSYGDMTRKINESINSKVKIKLIKSNGAAIYSDIGEIAGLEVCNNSPE